MAVAGGAVPAVLIMPVADCGIMVGPSTNVAASVVVGVDEAIDKLRAGKSCYLRMYLDNLVQLKRRWEHEGSGKA